MPSLTGLSMSSGTERRLDDESSYRHDREGRRKWAHPRERDVLLLIEAMSAMVEHMLTLCATPAEVEEWLAAVTELVSEYKVTRVGTADSSRSEE